MRRRPVSDVLNVNGVAGVDEAFVVTPAFARGDGNVAVNLVNTPYIGIEHVAQPEQEAFGVGESVAGAERGRNLERVADRKHERGPRAELVQRAKPERNETADPRILENERARVWVLALERIDDPLPELLRGRGIEPGGWERCQVVPRASHRRQQLVVDGTKDL